MSLKRNQRSSTNKTLTVQRFLENEVLGSKRVGSINYYLYPKAWAGLNNYYAIELNQPNTYHLGYTGASTIVFKCEIATDAVGPIFGVTGKARIECGGGNIVWYNDSNTAVYSVAIPTGVHLVGVYSDNGKLKPYLDGKVTDTGDAKAMTNMTTERDFYPGSASTDAVNGAVTGVCLSSASSTYAIKIYEIVGTFAQYYSSTGTLKQQFMHFYACSRDEDGTYPYFYETRSDTAFVIDTNAGSSITGVTAAAGVGGKVTYGVQLHDLQEAFGTPYRQLMAILCDDGGVDRGGQGAEQYYAGWDDPVSINENKLRNADTQEIVVSDGKTFASAFRLPSNALPSGATITYPRDDSDPVYGYEDGDLIRGRKPKWNLWADNIGAFRYVKQVSGWGVYGQNYSYQMRYNIYKDLFGNTILNNDDPDMLAVFDGYSNASSAWHAPRLEVTGLPVINTYNSFAYFKDVANMYRRNTNEQSVTYVFDSGEGDGSVRAVLGNLPYWSVSAANQTTNMKIYGLLVRGAYYDNGSYHDVFKMIKKESSPLSADSSDAVKTLYQQTGETANMVVTALTDSARILALDGTFNMYYIMGMLRTNSSTITDSNLIDCSRLVPSVRSKSIVYQNYSNLMLVGFKNAGGKVTVNGNLYDTYISSATSDNQNVMGEETHILQPTDNVYRIATAFKFSLLDSNQNPLELYNNSDLHQPKFFAYMEYVRMADDRSFMIMPSSQFGYADSKNDLPTGVISGVRSAYIVAQGRRVFRRASSTQYNEVKVVSKASQSDFPDDLTVYKTTYDSYDGTREFARNVYIYIWNQYSQSGDYSGSDKIIRLIPVTSDSDWPTSSDAEPTAVYYKRFGTGEEDDRYYLWRNGQCVKATVVHLPNKESFPEIGDYYKDESTGKIYWNNYTYGTHSYATNFVQTTVNSYASKSGFPASGSGGANLYYAQDTGLYYNYGAGADGHYRWHEDEVVVGTKPTTGAVGKIYKDGNDYFRWCNEDSTYYQISPWYDKGEVIERRAMFADTVAFYNGDNVWPFSTGGGTSRPTGLDDINMITKNGVYQANDSKYYATAMFYNQDVMQTSSDVNPSSRYNTYTDGNSPIVHPKTIMVKIYEKATAPHAWNVIGATMSDKVENWMFTVGNIIVGSTARTCCYFLLSRNEEQEYLLDNGDNAVVKAMLGLCYKMSDTYESYVDLDSTLTNFMPFKLSLYKQLPTKPYVMNGNTPEFDSTHNTTTVFENLNINMPNTNYTSGNYTVQIKSDRYLEGFRMNASGNVKSGIFNDNCYYLEITTSGTIEPGATFLFKMTAQ